jgi:hypothetical protein
LLYHYFINVMVCYYKVTVLSSAEEESKENWQSLIAAAETEEEESSSEENSIALFSLTYHSVPQPCEGSPPPEQLQW